MGEVIGQILPLAVGVALSLIPIIAVILMLFTERAKANSVSFLVGWILGLVVVGGIALAIADASGAGSDSGQPSDGVGTVKLVLGVGLVFLALRSWKQRPQEGETPEMPGWMGSIDKFSAPKSFGFAALLSGINPKNLALNIAAVTTIAAANLTTGEQVGTLAVFIVLASATVAAPVVIYLIIGHKADHLLNAMKTWLIMHNNAVMVVLFLVFGVKLLGDGISILAG